MPSCASLRGAGLSVHAAFEAPTAVSCSPANRLEWIVARNAIKERAFGFLPVLAHPIGGTVDAPQVHHAALAVQDAAADHRVERRRVAHVWLPHAERLLRTRLDGLIRCDDAEVAVVSAKRADFGAGVVVRLAASPGPLRTVKLWLPGRAIEAGFRCDARELDLEALALTEGGARVQLARRLTSVRLVSAVLPAT